MSSGGDLKVTCDVGGTFTDVVLTDDQGNVRLGKSPTAPERPLRGHPRRPRGSPARGGGGGTARPNGRLFVYTTTHATNAIIEGKTARTAFLCTEGFPDILVLREGGKAASTQVPLPDPYVPRRLTFEVRERIDADGDRRRAARRGGRAPRARHRSPRSRSRR